MKRTFYKWLALWAISSNLTACGTVLSLTEKDYAVYGGVSRDFQALQAGGALGVLAAIDLPLSFVLDTLMLPITLSQ